MLQIGRYNELEVASATPDGFVLGSGSAQAFLPGREAPEGLAIGQSLRVFVYVDAQHRPLATLREARAQVGEFAFLRCVQVNEQGAFLDWGVPKDLFVPFAEQHRRMVEGRSYVVAVRLDRHIARPLATSKLGPCFDYDIKNVALGSEQSVMVFDHNEAGAKVVVAQRYLGLIYTDETFRELPVGSRHVGYVAKLRSDNRLDMTLTPSLPGAQARLRDQAQQTILDALERAGGFLPVHDKSKPEEIQRALGLSKQVFKRSVGALYKARRVRIERDGIHLVASDGASEAPEAGESPARRRKP